MRIARIIAISIIILYDKSAKNMIADILKYRRIKREFYGNTKMSI